MVVVADTSPINYLVLIDQIDLLTAIRANSNCGRGSRGSRCSLRKGLERVGEPHVKHVKGRIWEMRLKGQSGISRALYVTAVGKRVVMVRVFVKKTEKTPAARDRAGHDPREID